MSMRFTLIIGADRLLAFQSVVSSFISLYYDLVYHPVPHFSLSKFAGLHPGGEGVLYDATVAGKDATAVFFGLHRAAVLEKYARLIIGQVRMLFSYTLLLLQQYSDGVSLAF